MENLLQSLMITIPETQAIVIQSILIVFGLWIIRTVILKLTVVKIQNDHTRYIWRQIVQYFVFLLGMVLLIRLWFSGVQSILTFLGLISAAITIILKEPILNLFAWVTIIWRELFSVGDRIEIGKYKGDVIDMGFFYFTLMEIGQWVGGRPKHRASSQSAQWDCDYGGSGQLQPRVAIRMERNSRNDHGRQ